MFMGRFNKRVIGGLTAALALVGSAFAGEYLVTNFDDGTNQHNLGYYYYLYGSGNPDAGNEYERGLVWNGGPDEYGPMTYLPFEGGYGGAGYSAALIIDPLPLADGDLDKDKFHPKHLAGEASGYYPAFGFGISLTEDDNTGYGADFEKVEKVSFYAKTDNPGLVAMFKIELTLNSPTGPLGQGYRTDYPDVDKSNWHTNAYMVKFAPTTEWAKYEFSIKDVKAPTFDGNGCGTPASSNGHSNDSTCYSGTADNYAGGMGGGKAGDLAQAGWYGLRYTFDPKLATKLAWAINSDGEDADGNKNGDLAGSKVALYIDDVKLVGAQVNENFYVAPWICQNCVSETFGPTGDHKVLSDFEGADSDQAGEDGDALLNSRNFYWYSYTDKASGGTSAIDNLELNEKVTEYENWIMPTDGNGRGGTNGPSIEFTLGPQYNHIDDPSKKIAGFVGIGANLYDDSAAIRGESDLKFLDASAFTGVYFEYRTSQSVDKVDVEVTDNCDAANFAADKDGEVLFTRLSGTGGVWKSAKFTWADLALPGWVKKSGTRRGGPAATCGADLRKNNLAQLKFKIDAATGGSGTLAIDNVAFLGATEWADGVSVKLVGSRAKATGLRATYNRGVVGVNWNAAQSVASGKISLVNVRGRVVASAPIKMSGSKVTANLGAGTIPTGMYFVRVNAKDLNGKKIVQQAPLSIVK